MSVRIHQWCAPSYEIDVRVIPDSDGFYFAIAAATERTQHYSISATALSRSPRRAAAFALIELGEALQK